MGCAGVAVRGAVARAFDVRKVNTEFAAADRVVVEVAHGRGGGVSVGELGEAVALGAARLAVVDEAEMQERADGRADLGDLLFGEACIASVKSDLVTYENKTAGSW